jgi:hypothetical protein
MGKMDKGIKSQGQPNASQKQTNNRDEKNSKQMVSYLHQHFGSDWGLNQVHHLLEQTFFNQPWLDGIIDRQTPHDSDGVQRCFRR